MKRAIKFRIWDSEMIYLSQMNAVLKDFNCDEFPLMQFTGLTDKNGKDIYEGDVIEFTFFSYGEYELETIKTGNIEFNGLSFIFISEQEIYSLYELNFDSQSDIEVIGNIYENPELLNN